MAETIKEVYAALEAKGYNPVDQLAGYLLSGDPTYITSYDNARTKLRRHERYELIEAMVIISKEKLYAKNVPGCGHKNHWHCG